MWSMLLDTIKLVSTELQLLDFLWLLAEHHTCVLAYLKKGCSSLWNLPVEENCCLQYMILCTVLISIIDLQMSLSVGFKSHIFIWAKIYGHWNFTVQNCYMRLWVGRRLAFEGDIALTCTGHFCNSECHEWHLQHRSLRH